MGLPSWSFKNMTNFVEILTLSLENIWSIWNIEPAKVTALATLINVLLGITTLIILIINSKKDSTNVDVIAKRAQNGPLILLHQNDEFILFEVYNKSSSSVTINEVGFKSKNQFINLVDLAHAYMSLQESVKALGTIEGVGLPGKIEPKSQGLFLVNYSGLRTAALAYQKNESVEFGEKRVITAYQELEKSLVYQTKNLQIVPYVSTGSGERIIGKKSSVKIGNLAL